MTSSEAQEAPIPKVEPQKEHRWLQRIVGEWTYEGDCATGPDKPRVAFSGTESVRSIGDLWVVGEGRGEMPGGADEATTMVTLGFNTQTQRFVGSWVGSMMTHMWTYDGWLDEAGRVLTLESEGPKMTGEGTAKYRDVVELENDDHRILRSLAQGEDGSWVEFMTAHYRRKK
jgi:hypothetical protein